jgi:hypothetical protein
MSSKNNKKLVALLGGRVYSDSITLRRFLIPPIRKRLSDEGIDFIIATNNPKSAEQFEQIKGLKVVRTSDKVKKDFASRQREVKPNFGAETRETINQYAIDNEYELVCHLDDNIINIFYRHNRKNKLVKKNKPEAFYDIMKLLFYVSEHSNTGAIGIMMSCFLSSGKIRITAGFPYSLFVHRVDKDFKFENSTEDDILMSIYNGENHKPSGVIRNALFYGKTGKKTSKDGNRKIYNEMLKENKRGEYCESKYPHIYTRKVSYMVKSSSIQKEPMLQHKHLLKKPKIWDSELKVDDTVLPQIKKTLLMIQEREA